MLLLLSQSLPLPVKAESWTLPLGPEDFKSQFQSRAGSGGVGGGGRIRENCLWCYLISPSREWASRRTPDAHYQPLMTSEGGARGWGCLRCHIAANTAAAEHFKPSPWPSLNSQQLNLGDGKRAQSGEKSVPDDFLLFCAFSSAPTPLLPSSPISAIVQKHLCPPFASCCFPPPQHPYYPPPPLPTPETKRPGNHSVPQVISGACLASPPPNPTHHPPFFYFPASLHPFAPPLPQSPTLQCIPAWQTTWDFTSPLKSAASGNHSSSCNILVF